MFAVTTETFDRMLTFFLIILLDGPAKKLQQPFNTVGVNTLRSL